MKEPELFYEDAAIYLNEERMEETLRSLPDWRREKVERMRFQADKRLSVAAGHLLDQVLRKYGLDPEEVSLGSSGRPFFPGNPLYFSLSHTTGAAVIAVYDVPVGVDMEMVQEKKYSESMIRRFYLPAEKEALLHASDEGARLRLFIRMWTVKEAYGKCIGTGIKDALKMDSVHPFQSVRLFYPVCPLNGDYLVTVCAERKQ